MEFDKTFIIRLLKNDKKAQELFYQHLAPKMYGVCLRFALDKDDAADILQDGFIRVFVHLKDFRGEGSIEGWVRRTIVNTAINYYNKRIKQGIKTDLDQVKNVNQTKSLVVENMSSRELMEMINELPEGYRTVFNLNIIEGYTHKEIGEMLGISENTSKSQLSRARVSLQKRLKKIEEKENL
ncbi:MAG: RNA polymerase sigma factor [Bacteroidales bacterium]|nr:RNA polymerase sigma factor [Bacteroidales bacterium]